MSEVNLKADRPLQIAGDDKKNTGMILYSDTVPLESSPIDLLHKEAQIIASSLTHPPSNQPFSNESLNNGMNQLSSYLRPLANGNFKQYNQLLEDVADLTKPANNPNGYRLALGKFNNNTHTYDDVSLTYVQGQYPMWEIVQPGQTLSQLAHKYCLTGVDSQTYMNVLQEANHLADDKIEVGQSLCLANISKFDLDTGPEQPSRPIELKPYRETLSVPDLEKSEEWYKNKLDFHVVISKDYPGVRVADLDNGSSGIELVENKNSIAWCAPGKGKECPQRPEAPGHSAIQGITQISFEVPDVDALKSVLEQRGVKSEWGPQTNCDFGEKIFFVRDNNANLIMFHQKFDCPSSPTSLGTFLLDRMDTDRKGYVTQQELAQAMQGPSNVGDDKPNRTEAINHVY